jgi:hypothetical protein
MLGSKRSGAIGKIDDVQATVAQRCGSGVHLMKTLIHNAIWRILDVDRRRDLAVRHRNPRTQTPEFAMSVSACAVPGGSVGASPQRSEQTHARDQLDTGPSRSDK